MRAWYGNAAHKDNNFAFDYLPKLDKPHDILQVFEDMHQGKMNGYFCQGFNPLAAFPCKAKVGGALKKLKYLVTIDPLATETAVFWENHGEYNDVDPAKIQTEVFRLPSTCFAEEDGSLVSSSRVLQWHWKGADPPGETKTDPEIMAGIFLKLRELYQKEGGAFPDPILNVTWNYAIASAPSPQEMAREYSGKALDDLMDPKDKTKVVRKAGEQLDGFAQLTDDGKTACGCWIFAGAWSEKGNLMARRDNSDPSGLGNTLNWAYSWPANRRVLYNRASCDPSGKPWDPTRKQVWWSESAGRWVGNDVPDFKPDSNPKDHMGPFIMNPEGVGRLFAPLAAFAEGPFSEFYEPIESPIDNPLHPQQTHNPVVKRFKTPEDKYGTPKDGYTVVCTTYRLTELYHYWTKNNPMNVQLIPEPFVEIAAEMAQEMGLTGGEKVKVSSIRGEYIAKAMVTKRIKGMMIDGEKI